MNRAALTFFVLALALSVISCSALPQSKSSPSTGVAPYAQPMPAATAAPAAPPVGGRQSTGESSNSVPNAASVERMIVYTVQLNVEVADTEKAMNEITALAAEFKGYVAGANMSRDTKGLMRGTVTLRLPAESLDAAQKRIEDAGLKVLSRNRNSNDVTDQYTDLDSRLKNLQATEDELRKMMDTVREKSGKAEDILAVYNRLSEIRGQIEQIKGQMNVLSNRTTYATLTVTLTPHEEVQVVEPDAWLPNQTAREALRSLVQALQGLIDLGIWMILFLLPLALVFLLPLVIIVLIVRARLNRRKPRPAPSA
jgi:hypothetical protein